MSLAMTAPGFGIGIGFGFGFGYVYILNRPHSLLLKAGSRSTINTPTWQLWRSTGICDHCRGVQGIQRWFEFEDYGSLLVPIGNACAQQPGSTPTAISSRSVGGLRPCFTSASTRECGMGFA